MARTMPTRFTVALGIQEGACNPSGICHAILKACKEIRDEDGGTTTIREDPAVRLMVHQLAYLCNVSEIDNTLDVYRRLHDECLKKDDEIAEKLRLRLKEFE